jgi:hypothetical protein
VHECWYLCSRFIDDSQVGEQQAFKWTKKYTRHNSVLKSLIITKVQVTAESNYERRTQFCNWFLQAIYDDDVLGPELTFFTEDWVHVSECVNS